MNSVDPSSGDDARTLWHGRFAASPAEDLIAFTQSLSFDRTLWREDIECSRAHVRGLAHVGLLNGDETKQILNALDVVEDELANGAFVFAPSDEDIHTAIERRVTELAGPAGAKLHTGRSRNDQSVTGLRLWCKRRINDIAARIIALQEVLLDRARWALEEDVYLPGYTHLQRAQPISLAHHFLAHAWAFGRDLERLWQTLERLDVSVLGAGALAGSSLPLDPDFTAHHMGFPRRFDNSLDAVSDRDFVAELLFDIALIGTHLSRLGEEWVLWTTEEFGFAVLDDAYSTGSSMLPQKKNADIAELSRGKTGRLIGNLTGLLVVLKGLPLAYNRDLQEDKEPLFDSVGQVMLGLAAVTGMIATAQLNAGVMKGAADAPVLAATDLAEHLVRSGMPFRRAHAVVGSIVRRSLAGEGALIDLVRAEPLLGDEAAELCGPGVAVRNRTTPGGAGQGPVAVQIETFQGSLSRWTDRLTAQQKNDSEKGAR
ncbi:MAG: argininosuccinate lyase [Actinomycetota bacterium]